MPCHQAQMLPFEAKDRRIGRSADSGGVLGDGLHDWPQVGWRARDHPQDLARRSLLLQGFGHLIMGLRHRAVLLLQFRKQSDVLDGDGGLVGQRVDQSHFGLGKQADLLARHRDGTDAPALAKQGCVQLSSDSARFIEGVETRRVREYIGHVDGDSLTNGSRGEPRIVQRARKCRFNGLHPLRPPSRRNHRQEPAIGQEEQANGRAAEAQRTPQDRLEDRCGVSEGRRDGPNAAAGRRLALERPRQLAAANLQFLEQARVLDHDDRLRREGLEDSNLLLGEREDLGAAKLDYPHRHALSQQRNGHDGAMSKAPRESAHRRELVHLVLEIDDMYRLPVEHRAAAGRSANQRDQGVADRSLGDRAVMGCEAQRVAVHTED
jgi:hypothetical protein